MKQEKYKMKFNGGKSDKKKAGRWASAMAFEGGKRRIFH